MIKESRYTDQQQETPELATGSTLKPGKEQQREQNRKILKQEMDWLYEIIKRRLDAYQRKDIYKEPDVPAITGADSFYAKFVQVHNLTPDDRKIIMLALMADIQLPKLEYLNLEKSSLSKHLEIGGIKSKTNGGFMPTVQTGLFVLGESEFEYQERHMPLVDGSHGLYRKEILVKPKREENDSLSNTVLRLVDNAMSNILYGKDVEMEYSAEFPASLLQTKMEWDDLVISKGTQAGLHEMLVWLEHGQKLENMGLEKNIQPGFRALFYGPPGTGKTACVSLIGKRFGRKVYRVDLSQLVSKYIGETEKNLEKIFNIAEKRGWILFFDEADALFGKRTNVNTSNDRYANQETAYLLQRIETCSNLVILASNMKQNMDEAFIRRLQAIIYFPMPDVPERLRLWQNMYTSKFILDDQVRLEELANKYEIAGGSIVNVLRYSALMTVAENKIVIEKQHIMEGLRREYEKICRIMPK